MNTIMNIFSTYVEVILSEKNLVAEEDFLCSSRGYSTILTRCKHICHNMCPFAILTC